MIVCGYCARACGYWVIVCGYCEHLRRPLVFPGQTPPCGYWRVLAGIDSGLLHARVLTLTHSMRACAESGGGVQCPPIPANPRTLPRTCDDALRDLRVLARKARVNTRSNTRKRRPAPASPPAVLPLKERAMTSEDELREAVEERLQARIEASRRRRERLAALSAAKNARRAAGLRARHQRKLDRQQNKEDQ